MTRLSCMLCALFFALPAFSQQAPDRLTLLADELEDNQQTLDDLRLWADMQDASVYVASRDSRCWVYLEMAAQSREELVALNEQYRGRADEEYRRQAQILLSDNSNAVQEYESCFGSVVGARYERIASEEVSAYQPFRGRYNILANQYGEGDITARLNQTLSRREQLEQALAEEQQRQAVQVATIASVFSSAEVLRGGTWIPATRGMTIRALDEIRTGPNGRVRIQFSDRLNETNAGPTIINVASDSHVLIQAYLIRFDRPATRQGFVSLLKGTIRALTTNWGSGSAFHVRTGTSLCGIRGTEVAITYDPASDSANYWVDHGDAFVETALGQEQPLRPGELTEVNSGRVVSQREFAAAEYAALAELSTLPGDPVNEPQLTLAGANAAGTRQALPDFLNSSPTVAPAEAARRRAQVSVQRDLVSWLEAYVRRDWETIIRHLAPAGRRQIRDELERVGEVELIRQNQNGFPAVWEIDCLSCTSGESCEVFLRIAYQNNPSVFSNEQYRLTPRPDLQSEVWMITENVNPDQTQYDTSLAACAAR